MAKASRIAARQQQDVQSILDVLTELRSEMNRLAENIQNLHKKLDELNKPAIRVTNKK